MRARTAATATLQKPEQKVRAGLKRVCFLGHEASTVRALGRLLGKDFYLVVVESADDVLSALQTGARLDGLVLETQTPGEDGTRLIEATQSEQVSLPIFVFTSSDDPSLRNKMLKVGVRGFFRKPREIWKLAEALHNQLGPTRNRVTIPPIGIRADAVVAGAIRYIEENLVDIDSSTDVSRHLGVTREHLSRQFSKYTGHTLWDFITMCRVERAKELLREKTLLVKQVFREVGFNCESSFFRAFIKHTRLTPEGYRRTLIS